MIIISNFHKLIADPNLQDRRLVRPVSVGRLAGVRTSTDRCRRCSTAPGQAARRRLRRRQSSSGTDRLAGSEAPTSSAAAIPLLRPAGHRPRRAVGPVPGRSLRTAGATRSSTPLRHRGHLRPAVQALSRSRIKRRNSWARSPRSTSGSGPAAPTASARPHSPARASPLAAARSDDSTSVADREPPTGAEIPSVLVLTALSTLLRGTVFTDSGK
jgi:hypothetical protein